MNFEEHYAVPFAAGFPSLSFVIAPKSTNHWSEAIPSYPSVVNSSRNSLQSRIFLIRGPTKIPASTFAAEILIKKFCSGLNVSEFLSNA